MPAVDLERAPDQYTGHDYSQGDRWLLKIGDKSSHTCAILTPKLPPLETSETFQPQVVSKFGMFFMFMKFIRFLRLIGLPSQTLST